MEARVFTRREQIEKRHKRVRNSVRPPADINAATSGSDGPPPPRWCLTNSLSFPQVEGTPERPRLAVFRSNNHIYAQVIDDAAGHTLASVSTLTPEIRGKLDGSSNNVEAAKLVGTKIAELCKLKNIELVCFDRGGFRYHGRVQALADAAREGGLTF